MFATVRRLAKGKPLGDVVEALVLSGREYRVRSIRHRIRDGRATRARVTVYAKDGDRWIPVWRGGMDL